MKFTFNKGFIAEAEFRYLKLMKRQISPELEKEVEIFIIFFFFIVKLHFKQFNPDPKNFLKILNTYEGITNGFKCNHHYVNNNIEFDEKFKIILFFFISYKYCRKIANFFFML